MVRGRKFFSLSPQNQWFVIKTAGLVGLIRLGLWLLPFPTIRQLVDQMSHPTPETEPSRPMSIGQIVWTVKALANCVSAGINALVSRVSGAGDSRMAQVWASQGLLLTAIFSILTMVSFYILLKPIFLLIDLEPAVHEMAYNYSVIMCWGVFFFYESFSLDTIFRSVGNTFIPMIVIIITLTLNALLDPVLIFGWFGFPRLGMTGGAVAS